MATFGGLVITGMCLCILYLLESRPPTGSRTVIGKPAGPTTTASVHPAPDEASKEEQSRLMLLHPDHHVRREPKTIHLSWNITQDKRSPDGVLKSIYVINGQFPGPLIEARSGDELIVDVYNGITAEGHPGISIHWHGLSMKGANEMDGVVGLTQCAILSSEQFTYRFRIPDHQSGTFWYHAHSGVQRADGLYGGLVVHKPAHEDEAADPIMHQYEKEQLLLVGDWYHRQGNEVLEWFVDPDHYGLEPAPDSILLNGRGSFNCSMAVKARPVECKDVETPVIQITDADRVRIRVINTGVSAGFSIGLSHGTMRPITVDGGNSLNEDTPSAKTLGLIFPGERVDLIVDRAAVHTRETQNETSAKLTIELDNENMPLHNFALTRTQSFPVKWGNRDVDDKELPRRSKPGTVVAVFNLADASGQRQPTDSGVSTEPFHQAVLYSTMKIRAAKHNQPVGSINHTSWISPQPDARPLLSLEREEWAKVVPQPTDVHKFDVPWFKDTGPGKWVELAINNFDDKGHPFHLVSGTGSERSFLH
ncbi:hypothetical protein QQS21_003344 [Conoideocrella luteorostrata]|uniref:Laccase n=1 Tax=Conoideocrella luteorostrata TaxID=1105319 RepID=A0AAJ0CTI0_9HYPO|nr:hypothetical protein QQS21_003344 [Conoideocrella luteorostrata]